MRVKPRSSVSEVVGLDDGVLVVRVSAPPVEGLANRAVCELVADLVGVGKSSVTVERGERGRDKVVAIEGLSQERVDELLAKLKNERPGHPK
ncbi:MAG: DUF167 domain-containing protein [Betaproteobacteria bacterium]